MTTHVYIAIRGGALQGVRADTEDIVVHLVDYDNAESLGQTDEEHEIEEIEETWDQLETHTFGVW